MTDRMRESFEAWITASGRGHLLELDTPHLWYKDLNVTAWWTAWQAAWQEATIAAAMAATATVRALGVTEATDAVAKTPASASGEMAPAAPELSDLSGVEQPSSSPVPPRSWNYRVMEFTHGEETWRALHEVHYENGVPRGYSTGPAVVMWDGGEAASGNAAAEGILRNMRDSLAKPVLREQDFRSQ
jgi:hypothetical protein